MFSLSKNILVTLMVLIWTGVAFARGDDRSVPTAFASFEGGAMTYKSEMLESNDAGYGFAYAVGFYAGAERSLGIILRNDSSKIAFALNNSDITQNWLDSTIRYRVGPFYLGGIISNMSLVVKQDGTELRDATGSGYGGNAGMHLNLNRYYDVFLDASSVSISTARDVEERDITIGPRTDVDLGMMFHVTRQSVDFVLGYRYRQLAIKLDESYSELITTTYMGFRFNLFF